MKFKHTTYKVIPILALVAFLLSGSAFSQLTPVPTPGTPPPPYRDTDGPRYETAHWLVRMPEKSSINQTEVNNQGMQTVPKAAEFYTSGGDVERLLFYVVPFHGEDYLDDAGLYCHFIPETGDPYTEQVLSLDDIWGEQIGTADVPEIREFQVCITESGKVVVTVGVITGDITVYAALRTFVYDDDGFTLLSNIYCDENTTAIGINWSSWSNGKRFFPYSFFQLTDNPNSTLGSHGVTLYFTGNEKNSTGLSASYRVFRYDMNASSNSATVFDFMNTANNSLTKMFTINENANLAEPYAAAVYDNTEDDAVLVYNNYNPGTSSWSVYGTYYDYGLSSFSTTSLFTKSSGTKVPLLAGGTPDTAGSSEVVALMQGNSDSEFRVYRFSPTSWSGTTTINFGSTGVFADSNMRIITGSLSYLTNGRALLVFDSQEDAATVMPPSLLSYSPDPGAHVASNTILTKNYDLVAYPGIYFDNAASLTPGLTIMQVRKYPVYNPITRATVFTQAIYDVNNGEYFSMFFRIVGDESPSTLSTSFSPSPTLSISGAFGFAAQELTPPSGTGFATDPERLYRIDYTVANQSINNNTSFLMRSTDLVGSPTWNFRNQTYLNFINYSAGSFSNPKTHSFYVASQPTINNRQAFLQIFNTGTAANSSVTVNSISAVPLATSSMATDYNVGEWTFSTPPSYNDGWQNPAVVSFVSGRMTLNINELASSPNLSYGGSPLVAGVYRVSMLCELDSTTGSPTTADRGLSPVIGVGIRNAWTGAGNFYYQGYDTMYLGSSMSASYGETWKTFYVQIPVGGYDTNLWVELSDYGSAPNDDWNLLVYRVRLDRIY